jgi:hypothetical protein
MIKLYLLSDSWLASWAHFGHQGAAEVMVTLLSLPL